MTAQESRPRISIPLAPIEEVSTIVAWAAMVITLVLTVAAMRLARGLMLPVVMAILLTLLLSAPVRWLRKWHIPERFGAAIVVFGMVGAAVGAGALLVSPAIDWVNAAPLTLQKVERKIRLISQPLATLQKSAEQMERVGATPHEGSVSQVQVTTPGLFARISLEATQAVPALLSVVFLTYFLLASGPLFRRKLAEFMPGRGEVKHIEHLLSTIEISTSRFLATTFAINAGVGIVTALALWAVGVPSAPLGGALAAVLNFVPYLGPLVTVSVIALAALASIDNTAHAMLAPALFVLIHLVESNVVTPTLLGRRLPLNTVTIFLGLIFFSWVWGVPGAVIAVPLTVVAKLACDHIPSLHRLGALLDS